jgi:hypothetical protein
MMRIMRRSPWIAAACKWLAVLVLALAPATALARQDETEPDVVDARLEGYAGNVSLPQGSSGMTWAIFVVLAVFTAAGLFKDAKRSHLD